MQFFAILFAAQIIIVGLLLSVSPSSHTASVVRHSVKQVLGTSLIAQDVTQPSDPQPVDQTSQATNDQAPTEEVSITPSEPTPTASEMQSNGIQPTTQETPTITQSVSEIPTVSLSPETTASSEIVNPAVVNPDDTINNSHIPTSLIDDAQEEDDSLASASAEDKPTLLASFADSNIKKIDGSLKIDNFTSTAFLIQRLADNLLQAQAVLATSSVPTFQTFRNLCRQANVQLQTEQLQVPEDLEQDIEIARGTCIALQQ